MMREMSGRGRDPKLSSSELVAKLKTLGDRYGLPAFTRFKVGDLVTPTKGLAVKGAGEPHLIVEIVDSKPRSEPIDTAILAGSDTVHAGSNAFGARMDMRVLTLAGGSGKIASWSVESWVFETWTPPATTAN